MKKILMIGTGGTISCEASDDGLSPAKLAEELLKYCPKVKEICDVECIQVINIDSTNMRPGHWLMIEDAIKENYDRFDGFVITHGTDTLAYTASALSYLIQNSKKPIVITGAQLPIGEVGTDAIKNVMDAFTLASDDDSHGVQVVFCGKVIQGTRARKNFTKQFSAFISVNFPELAKVQDGKIIRYINTDVKGEVEFYDYLNPNVGILKFVPGLKNNVLEYLLDQYDGLVIESFGVGGLPEYSDFYKQIKDATDNGKIIVMTTQVSNEGSDLSVYEVGAKVKKEVNILEAYDMSTEAAFTKLMWVLSENPNFEKAKKLFYKRIADDILTYNI